MKKILSFAFLIVIVTCATSCTKYEGDRGILIDPNGRKAPTTQTTEATKCDEGFLVDPNGRTKVARTHTNENNEGAE